MLDSDQFIEFQGEVPKMDGRGWQSAAFEDQGLVQFDHPLDEGKFFSHFSDAVDWEGILDIFQAIQFDFIRQLLLPRRNKILDGI